MKPKLIPLPAMGTEVLWDNKDKTYIYGRNGSGKTMLLNGMMDYCADNNVTYAHYDAEVSLSEIDHYLTKDPLNIAYAILSLGNFLDNFRDDVRRHLIHRANIKYPHCDIDEYITEIDTLKEFIRLTGDGHSRLFVMIMKIISNPLASYYFLDLAETSLHLIVLGKLIPFIAREAPYMKIVLTTHNPSLVDIGEPYQIQYISLVDGRAV